MIDDDDIATGTFIETEIAVPNDVLTWAIDAAGGTGEEGEWNIYMPDDGQVEHCVQVWGDVTDEDHEPLVGFYGSGHGSTRAEADWRWDFSPVEAREVAAALIAAASKAEDSAAMWREEADRQIPWTDGVIPPQGFEDEWAAIQRDKGIKVVPDDEHGWRHADA